MEQGNRRGGKKLYRLRARRVMPKFDARDEKLARRALGVAFRQRGVVVRRV